MFRESPPRPCSKIPKQYFVNLFFKEQKYGVQNRSLFFCIYFFESTFFRKNTPVSNITRFCIQGGFEHLSGGSYHLHIVLVIHMLLALIQEYDSVHTCITPPHSEKGTSWRERMLTNRDSFDWPGVGWLWVFLFLCQIEKGIRTGTCRERLRNRKDAAPKGCWCSRYARSAASCCMADAALESWPDA